MASIVNNEKGFKILKTTRNEIIELLNSPGICDGCGNNKIKDGFYIAAMNRWYCTDCYKSWYKRAEYYPEESFYEERNFKNIYNALYINAN